MKPPDLFLALHSAHPVPSPQSFHRSILDYLHLKHQSLQSSIPILSHVESVSSLHVTYLLSRASESGLLQRLCHGVRWGCCARKPHPFSLSPIFRVSSTPSCNPFNPSPRGSQVLSSGGMDGVHDTTFCSSCLGALISCNLDHSYYPYYALICPLSILWISQFGDMASAPTQGHRVISSANGKHDIMSGYSVSCFY